MFTTKLQEQARVGCSRGVFDGDGLTTSWLKGNETLESLSFGTELRDLLETLRKDGLLKDLCSMQEFCRMHPQARMAGRQIFYASRIDTQKYRYYLRLFPQKQKFHIFCYQRDLFRRDLPAPDFNYIYGKDKKSKPGGER